MKIFSVINLSEESPQSDSIAKTTTEACHQVHALLTQGSDFIDIGARSSGSKTPVIDDQTEQHRLAPFFTQLGKQYKDQLSLDTWSIETALAYIHQVHIINYTGTDFPDYFLKELANSNCGIVLNYLPAKNPYELRKAPFTLPNVQLIETYFKKTVAHLESRGVKVIAIDPNLGVWHPQTPDAEKPDIQRQIIDHLGVFKQIAPLFIVAPRKLGVLNIPLTNMILSHSIDYLRTHDLLQIQMLLNSKH